MKTLGSITLYDLMSEDIDVWISKNRDFGLNLEIDDEKGRPLIREKGLNKYAAESFAEFCRSYLIHYEKAMNN